MTVFNRTYAAYYNLLYSDKDYAGEAAFVKGLIQKHHPEAKTILELGCGTGIHAMHLAGHGYAIAGVDRSADMLHKAKERAQEKKAAIEVFEGDARTFRTDARFDAVISLFHVLSYQTSNADLRAVFKTAKDHLKPGGIFIFDCWYGPAVLTDRPHARVKTLEDETVAVTRHADPVMNAAENRVTVNYRIAVTHKADGTTENIYECHEMRYLFEPEVRLLAEDAGFACLSSGAWLSDAPADFDSWNAYFVLRA